MLPERNQACHQSFASDVCTIELQFTPRPNDTTALSRSVLASALDDDGSLVLIERPE